MPQLICNNVEEYILARFVLCGEIKAVEIGKGTPYATKSVTVAAARLKKEQVKSRKVKIEGEKKKRTERERIARRIYPYQYADKKTFYRLSQKGFEEVEELFGKEAMRHLILLLGESRYTGTRVAQIKRRRMYEVILLFSKMGFAIDGLTIRANTGHDSGNAQSANERYIQNGQKGIFEENGKLKTVPNIVSQISGKEGYFLSGKALRKMTKETETLRSRFEMFRAEGLLIYRSDVFAIYLLRSAGEIWMRAAEMQIAYQTWRTTETYLPALMGKEKRSNLRKAIFFVSSAKVYTDFTTNRTKNRKINPNDIYNLAYVVPMTENASDIVKMLLVVNWKQKLNQILIPLPPKKADPEDGWIEAEGERVGIYNFLCSNIGQMQRMKQRIESRKSIVIIHDWQEEAADILYGKETEKMIIDTATFKELLEAVLSKEDVQEGEK